MSQLTDIRRALRDTVARLCPDVRVATAPSDYSEPTNRFTLRILLGEADEGTENRLDELLAPDGTASVKAALEADRTLGGLIDDLRVAKHGGYLLYETGPNVRQLGTEFTVDTIF